MLKKYFNKILLWNFLIAVGISMLLLLVVQWSLKSYTRHGEGIPVPNTVGKSFLEAQQLLEDAGMLVQVMDSIYDDAKPPLSIVEQNPKSGTKVKRGRTIYLVLNASNKPTVELPDLVGRSSYKYAKMQLEGFGLKVGEPVFKPDPHLNAVIGVLVDGRMAKKKMRVPRGAQITLLVGDGLGNARVTTPYVLGLRYEDAEFKLHGYSLNIGSITVDEGVIDTMGAIIYRQEPIYKEGSSIRMGEAIDLWLAKELPEGMVIDESLYDKLDTVPAEPVE